MLGPNQNVKLFFLVPFSRQSNRQKRFKNKEKGKPIYQESTKSSLNPDCSPFLSHNPEIFGVGSNHSGHCSSKSISQWWRTWPFWRCSVVSFETLPWRPQVPWRAPPQPPLLTLAAHLLQEKHNLQLVLVYSHAQQVQQTNKKTRSLFWRRILSYMVFFIWLF